MDAKERYFWDLTGYLIVRNVLTPEEIAAANAAIDACMDRMTQGEDNNRSRDSVSLQGKGQKILDNTIELEKPFCDPFRKMLVHPQVVVRLNEMCGKGFRYDHGSWVAFSEQGTEGFTLHGSGEPHQPNVAYHHQYGRMYCNGVTATWQLADGAAGAGGFACVAGSHKSGFPMPVGVRTCDADLGVVIQPETKAGDVIFFMDGAQTHGTLPWTSEVPRRSVLFKYASRTAVRFGVSTQVAPPEIYWDEAIVEGMSAIERAVMYGPCTNTGGGKAYLDIDEEGNVRASDMSP